MRIKRSLVAPAGVVLVALATGAWLLQPDGCYERAPQQGETPLSAQATLLERHTAAAGSLSFGSCWNANEALTPTILEEGHAVFSDELNHASIIDSIRLAKAITKCTTVVFKHRDMDDLVAKLEANRGARRKLIWTDGVFSMEGSICRLPELLDVAQKYEAVASRPSAPRAAHPPTPRRRKIRSARAIVRAPQNADRRFSR